MARASALKKKAFVLEYCNGQGFRNEKRERRSMHGQEAHMLINRDHVYRHYELSQINTTITDSEQTT